METPDNDSDLKETSMKHYRALISIPIEANSDAHALTVANEQAARSVIPTGQLLGMSGRRGSSKRPD